MVQERRPSTFSTPSSHPLFESDGKTCSHLLHKTALKFFFNKICQRETGDALTCPPFIKSDSIVVFISSLFHLPKIMQIIIIVENELTIFSFFFLQYSLNSHHARLLSIGTVIYISHATLHSTGELGGVFVFPSNKHI